MMTICYPLGVGMVPLMVLIDLEHNLHLLHTNISFHELAVSSFANLLLSCTLLSLYLPSLCFSLL